MKFKAMLYRDPVAFSAAGLLLIAGIVLLFIYKTAAFVCLGAFLLLFTAAVLHSFFEIGSTERYSLEINKALSLKSSDYSADLPLPGALINEAGSVVYCNNEFSETILGGDRSPKLLINDLFPNGISFAELCEKNILNAEYNGRLYTVFVFAFKDKHKKLLSLYFYDDTYFKDTETEYILSRPFVMFINVDNIEILSRQLSDSRFALVTSGIESIIENWLINESVIIKKLSAGRYMVIGEKRVLDRLCDAKFSVLNDIREYKFNNVPVGATLSVGVGAGNELALCEEFAKKALDMSQGRGGDQTVVFNGDEYRYFGGISNLYNDDSKVSPRQTAADIIKLIRKYDNVLIMGHKFSDNDSVGSSLGMLFLVSACGSSAEIVVDRKRTLSEGLIALAEGEGYEFFISPDEAQKKCDSNTLLIITDTHRPSLTECPALCDIAGAKIVIDHHRRMEDYISDADIFYHKPSPSSACEMVAELIEYSSVQQKLPSVIATSLLSGIVLDTKEYVLRTSQRTFEAAAFLKRNGAEPITVKKLFAVNEEQIALKNAIVSRGFAYRDCMICATDITDKNLRLISSKAADELLNINGVKAGFVITLIPGGVNISARSFGEENVQLIMELLGGGGHSTMAATQIPDIGLEEAVAALRDAIDRYYSAK